MMVAESWFRNILRGSKKHGTESEKLVLGVLAFEVASLMSKLVQLWQCLNDKQVAKLREEIANSDGIKKLVSDDDEHIVRLMCAEMMDNLGNVARAVARISKKCRDPLLRSFESAFKDLLTMGTDPYGWQFTWKKMDRKVKKMEKFILVNSNLYQEMEMLSDLEQTLRKMKRQADMDSIHLVGFEKKLVWKQHEVKHLKQTSLWNKTYDYTVQLLVGSVFTVFGKIGHVFGINNIAEMGVKDSGVLGSDHIPRSHSVALMQSSVHPSESVTYRFSSGPLGTKSGPLLSRNNMNSSYSGPIQTSSVEGSPVTRRQSSVGFYSGPLSRSSPSPLNRTNKSGRRHFQFWSRSSKSHKQSPRSKENQAFTAGHIKGSMIGGSTSAVTNYYQNSDTPFSGKLRKDVSLETVASTNKMQDTLASCRDKTKRLHAPPGSLGAAALSLHYANLIIVIEKLAASPHLIGQDARDDLYNMLPASIRIALRAKLKPCAKALTSSVYDTALAREWNEAISAILEWLAPLAHNMIRWHTERSIEHKNFGFRTNVLLVQTLYFANQEKIEVIITELLVGLNYIWRFGREINAKAIAGCSSGITIDDYLEE